METKQELRKRILALRDAIPSSDRERYDMHIRESVLKTVSERMTDTVLTYFSFRSEADTRVLIDELLNRGVRVAVPRVEKPDIGFFYIDSKDDLIDGYMGIPEPSPRCTPWDHGEDTFCDRTIILVPGSVFDCDNHRIGYGGGYYDRFLSAYPDLYSIGLAYECQIIDEIPADPWDQALNALIF